MGRHTAERRARIGQFSGSGRRATDQDFAVSTDRNPITEAVNAAKAAALDSTTDTTTKEN